MAHPYPIPWKGRRTSVSRPWRRALTACAGSIPRDTAHSGYLPTTGGGTDQTRRLAHTSGSLQHRNQTSRCNVEGGGVTYRIVGRCSARNDRRPRFHAVRSSKPWSPASSSSTSSRPCSQADPTAAPKYQRTVQRYSLEPHEPALRRENSKKCLDRRRPGLAEARLLPVPGV